MSLSLNRPVVFLFRDVLQYIASKNLPKVDQTIVPEPSPPPAVGAAQSVEPVFIAPPLPMIDAEEFIDIPNTAMRSTIAKRLTESKVGSFYL